MSRRPTTGYQPGDMARAAGLRPDPFQEIAEMNRALDRAPLGLPFDRRQLVRPQPKRQAFNPLHRSVHVIVDSLKVCGVLGKALKGRLANAMAGRDDVRIAPNCFGGGRHEQPFQGHHAGAQVNQDVGQLKFSSEGCGDCRESRVGGGAQNPVPGEGPPPKRRPEFIPPADWPTNHEIAVRALCRNDAGGAGCGCDPDRPCAVAGKIYADQVGAVLSGLAARDRLISPTIQRNRGTQNEAGVS